MLFINHLRNQNYTNFVAPDPIEEWINGPSKAPGRLTSSPWPERIEIKTIQKINGKYKVTGEIIEVTSVEKVQGGYADKKPINLIVEKLNDNWLITDFSFTE